MPVELAREGLKPDVEAWEDGFRTLKQPEAFEWWYFDFQLEDGTTVVVCFTTKGKGVGQPVLTPNATTIIKDPDGNKQKITIDYSAGEFKAGESSCDVKIGHNTLNGDLDHYEIHTEGDGTVVDLAFDRGAPSWRPGIGINYFDRERKKYMGWVIPVPYGVAQCSITRGGEAKTLKGVVYHDHNWGNLMLAAFLDHWYWGRAHVEDSSMIFAQLVSVSLFGFGGARVPVFYLARGDRMLIDDPSPLTLVTRDFVKGPGGKVYPTLLDWHWHTGDGDIHIALRDVKMIDAVDLSQTMPSWERPLAHLLMKPWYYDFDAELELTVDIEGTHQRVAGRAIFERMMLK